MFRTKTASKLQVPVWLGFSVAVLSAASFCTAVNAQESTPETAQGISTLSSPVIPQQVRFSGSLPNRIGDTVEAVFRIYSKPQGGEALWTETQKIQVAQDGSYSVLLGAASMKGLPQTVFRNGQARWVGIAVERGEEEARIPLASAPYAMKAGDAQTLGGLSARSFVTQAQLAAAAQSLAVQAAQLMAPLTTATGTGTTNYIPIWTSSSNLGNSAIYQTGGFVGVGTTTPAAPLHVIGGGVHAALILQSGAGLGALIVGADSGANTLTPSVRKVARITMPDWAADATNLMFLSGDITGANNNDLYFGGSPGSADYAATGLHFVTAANGTTPGGKEQMTLTSAGSFGIGTKTPGATLEVNGTAKFDGLITFASGQTFPGGSGGGTVTSVASGAGLTGGPITSSGSLSIATAGVTNAMLLNPSVTVTAGSGLSGGGSVALGSSTTLSLNPTIVATTGNFSSTTSPAVSGEYAGAYGELGLYYKNSFVGVFGNDGTGADYGVVGVGGTGVLGNGGESGIGLYGTGALGVYGVGASNNSGELGTTIDDIATGVYGSNGTASTYGLLGTMTNGYQTGVYGTSATYGVYGNGTTYGVVGSSGSYTGVYGSGPSYGVFSHGTIGSSTYSAVVAALPDNRAVELYSMASTENWFEDFGKGQLQSGAVTVTLDSSFAEAANTETDYHVFLTPRGDCEGLYVTGETASGFEVHELHGGKSSVEFDYRIVARRRGFEGMRMEQLEADSETIEAIREQVRNRPAHRSLVLRKPVPNDGTHAAPSRPGFLSSGRPVLGPRSMRSHQAPPSKPLRP